MSPHNRALKWGVCHDKWESVSTPRTAGPRDSLSVLCASPLYFHTLDTLFPPLLSSALSGIVTGWLTFKDGHFRFQIE